MSLQKISGTVTNVRVSTNVSKAHGKKAEIKTREKLHLMIDGKAAYYSHGESMNVANGELISVAGRTNNEGLEALAFKNLSNGTQGDSNALTWKIWGVIAMAIGLIWGIPMIISGGPGLLFGFAMVMVVSGTGYWAWNEGIQRTEALNMCKKEGEE